MVSRHISNRENMSSEQLESARSYSEYVSSISTNSIADDHLCILFESCFGATGSYDENVSRWSTSFFGMDINKLKNEFVEDDERSFAQMWKHQVNLPILSFMVVPVGQQVVYNRDYVEILHRRCYTIYEN
jgi:hypothetical protein